MSASLILDIALLAIAIFIILKYAFEGFLKSVLNFLRLALSVILAFALRNPIAELFNNWFMKGAIVNWVNSSILQANAGENPAVNFIKIYNETPIFYTNVLTHFGLDTATLDKQIAEANTEQGAQALAETIGTPIATMLSTILAVLVVFIVAMIALTIVVKLLNCITKISGIKLINRLLGIALGVAIAIVGIWGLSILIKTLVDMLGPMYPEVFNQELIDNSMVLGFIDSLGINSLVENVKQQIITK